MKRLRSRADEMAPTMRFLISVCVNESYKDEIKSVLDRLVKRYEQYAERFAEKIGCEFEEISPYMYMGITAITNYMIFNEDEIIHPQIDIIIEKIKGLMTA